MQVTAILSGDVRGLQKKIAGLSHINRYALMKNISEGLRSSTLDRFRSTKSPEGKLWEPSLREKEGRGITLTKTALLKSSIKSIADATGAAVGTNTIYAATHQFGDEGRTIRAKRVKSLMFLYKGSWVKVKKVTVNIPARPYLGVSKEDMNDIKSEVQAAVRKA